MRERRTERFTRIKRVLKGKGGSWRFLSFLTLVLLLSRYFVPVCVFFCLSLSSLKHTHDDDDEGEKKRGSYLLL